MMVIIQGSLEMENDKTSWLLILNNSSWLGKTHGAYTLDTISKYSEMMVLPRFIRQ